MANAPPQRARIGRPRSESAASHAAIMDAVYALLQERSARDLTMEAVARRAGVGKPTLYKWWPSKATLVMAMFHERLANQPQSSKAQTAEQCLREKVRWLIGAFNGLFGKVMADLIAEGQSDPAILGELRDQHMRDRRAATVVEIERGKAAGEFPPDTDAELLIDAIFSPIYFRLLMRSPLSEAYGSQLVDQAIRGLQSANGRKPTRPRQGRRVVKPNVDQTLAVRKAKPSSTK